MSRKGSLGPAPKRIRLQDSADGQASFDNDEPLPELEDSENTKMMVDDVDDSIEEAEDDENSCSICLHSIMDRTVVPKCSHEFCFECLLVWTEQSRRCPLCSQAIGEYLIHSIRSRYDYRKHYLSPLRTSPPPSRPAQTVSMRQAARRTARRRYRDVEWGTRVREHEEFDKLERSILKRRWIYEHDLYAKHVASNPFTKYRPYPTPSQFSASQELISRTTTFLRRELQVWESLDVEFLTNLIISLMKAIDIRSESAVKLIAEFLDLDEPYTAGGRHVNAEHFAHEVYCYVRSPYRDLFVYDKVVQYDLPPNIPPPPELERSRRWHPSSPSPPRPVAGPSQANNSRRLRSSSRSSERSESWSPSGRRYSSSRNRETFVERGTSRRESDGDNLPRLPNNDACQDKGRKHPTNTSADQILDGVETETYGNSTTSKLSSSDGLVNSLSLTRNGSNNHVSLEKERRDVKGKGRAHEPITNDRAESEGPAGGKLQSTLKLNAPAETEPNNDVGHTPEKTPTCDRPSISRSLLKPPRNHSLLDSVKAHLSRNANSNPNPNPDRMRGPSLHRHSVNINSSSSTASTTISPPSRDQKSNAATPPNPIAQVPCISSGCREEETSPVDISRVGRQTSSDIRSKENLRGGNPSTSTSLEQIELSATGVTDAESPQIDSSSQRDGTVNTGNGVVNAITDAPGLPSSSDVKIPDHNICAVEAKPSTLEDSTSSHTSSLVTGSSSTRGLEPSASNSHPEEGHEDKSKLVLQIHDVPATPSNMAHSPIRNDAYIDTASITIVNQSAIPRVTETNTRTRLLARLAHEKSKAASAGVLAMAAPVLIHGADPRVFVGDRPPFSNLQLRASSSVNVVDDNTSRSLDDDETNSGGGHPRMWAARTGDPEGGTAGEDIKAREAKLRARVQLKARLAAEKRKIGGS